MVRPNCRVYARANLEKSLDDSKFAATCIIITPGHAGIMLTMVKNSAWPFRALRRRAGTVSRQAQSWLLPPWNRGPLLAHFIHIPKTAGTTILRWIRTNHVVVEIVSPANKRRVVFPNEPFFLYTGHLHPDRLVLSGHLRASTLRNVPAIGFVRNPVTRAISLHQHFLRHSDFAGDLSQFLGVITGETRLANTRTNQRILQMGRPMSYWLERREGFPRPDVYRIEEFEASVEALSQRFGLEHPPKSRAKAQVARRVEHATESQMATIQHLYWDDYHNFGYSL